MLPLLVALCASARADELIVAPFLQDVTPTSAWVVWETDADHAATVTFGEVGDEHTVTVTRRATEDGTFIEEAELDELSPLTRYRYRVTSGDAPAAEGDLITPGDTRGERSFRLVAVSDMQATPKAPGKWAEIVQDGILGWAREQWGDDVAGQFGMVLVPGDLVELGTSHDRWIDEFFAPVAPLAAHVPLYPVLGNHEINTHWYFDYFHLPADGDPALPDQWWSTVHENVLVLGLDTNLVLAWADQMTWLDERLAEACDDDAIDFAFAEVHHPYQSEVWTPGESILTGQLIDRMAAWSEQCGKPSIHFFGHTHAYARGQHPQAPHLMVDVACAGGAVDRWGAQPQRDYDAFSVATDDWGFVVVDVQGGADPRFRVRRFGRGNADEPADNVLLDEIEVRRYDTPPVAPAPLAPFGSLDGACVTLEATGYADPDDDPQQASEWQVARSCSGFDTPERDVWRQDRDLFFDVDLQAGDDLGDEVVRGLEPGDWCWRVRYRDAGLAWSDWSTPQPFEVTTRSRSENLLTNPGGEATVEGWFADEGALEATGAQRCGAAVPSQGGRALAIGGLCKPELPATARTTVDVSAEADAIDAGDLVLHLELDALGEGGVLGVEARFIGADVATISSSTEVVTLTPTWTRGAWELPVPAGTRSIAVVLSSDTGAQVDAIELSLGASGDLDCTPRYAPESTTEAQADPSCGGCGTTGGAASGTIGLLLAIAGRRRRAQS